MISILKKAVCLNCFQKSIPEPKQKLQISLQGLQGKGLLGKIIRLLDNSAVNYTAAVVLSILQIAFAILSSLALERWFSSEPGSTGSLECLICFSFQICSLICRHGNFNLGADAAADLRMSIVSCAKDKLLMLPADNLAQKGQEVASILNSEVSLMDMKFYFTSAVLAMPVTIVCCLAISYRRLGSYGLIVVGLPMLFLLVSIFVGRVKIKVQSRITFYRTKRVQIFVDCLRQAQLIRIEGLQLNKISLLDEVRRTEANWLLLQSLLTTLQKSFAQSITLLACTIAFALSIYSGRHINSAQIYATMQFLVLFRPSVVETASIGLSHFFELSSLIDRLHCKLFQTRVRVTPTILEDRPGIQLIRGGRETLLEMLGEQSQSIPPVGRPIQILEQSPILFQGSIKQNMVQGEEHDPSRVTEVLEQTQLSLDMGSGLSLQTYLTYPASNISSGQRQRISLARVLLSKSKWLVLQEPFSSLDPAVKRKVQANCSQHFGQTNTKIITANSEQQNQQTQHEQRTTEEKKTAQQIIRRPLQLKTADIFQTIKGSYLSPGVLLPFLAALFTQFVFVSCYYRLLQGYSKFAEAPDPAQLFLEQTALISCLFLSSIAMNLFLSWTCSNIGTSLQSKLLNSLLHSSVLTAQRLTSNDVHSVVGEGITGIDTQLPFSLSFTISGFTLSLAICLTLISGQQLVIVLFLTALFINQNCQPKLNSLKLAEQRAKGKLAGLFSFVIKSIVTVRGSHFIYFDRKLDLAIKESMDAQKAYWRFNRLFGLTVNFIAVAFTLALALTNDLSKTTVILLLQLSTLLQWSIRNLVTSRSYLACLGKVDLIVAELGCPIARGVIKESEDDLELAGITVSFEKVNVLKHLNLKIPRGQKVCLSGRTGSGKSTLLLTIAGLYEPDCGSVSRPSRFQYIPIDALLPSEKIESFISRDPEARERLVQEFGIGRDSNSLESKLERVKIYLARAKARQVDLLLIDEPNTGLARQQQLNVYQLLNMHFREATILVVAHEVPVGLRFFDTNKSIEQLMKAHQ